MKNIFNKLYKEKFLSQKESYQLFKFITSGRINNKELQSILIHMNKRGESKEEIIGAINALSEQIKYFPKPKYIYSDIVGTGGDMKNTINISTASAFVAATCGFKIIKHCNQGISGNFGSSDLLKKLDINLHISPEKSRQILDKLNICFLFAPDYHCGFKHTNNIRKKLKRKTIFNLLGPFLNPSFPPLTVIGVYKKEFINTAIEILKQLKYHRAIVLHGNETDEVTLNGITYVCELVNKKTFSYELKSQDFGLSEHPKVFPTNNIAEEKYSIVQKIMQGNGNRLYEELIAVNVAILLKVFGREDLQKNTALALKTIRSGDVYRHIINISNMSKEE